MYLTAQRLAICSGLFSRRQLKRLRHAFTGPDGPLAWDDELQITDQPIPYAIAGHAFSAALSAPCIAAFHKPLGVVTSRRADGGHLPVFSYLHGKGLPGGLEAVGRLDQDTRGLLLFTSDGTLLHRLTHPRWAVRRSYLVATEGELPLAQQTQILSGELELRDGHRPKPHHLAPLALDTLARELLAPGEDHSAYEITLSSGRYHEVRRIFAAGGTRVARLFRHSYGPLNLLDEELAALRVPETVLRLQPAQVEAVYASVSLPVPEPELEIVHLP